MPALGPILAGQNGVQSGAALPCGATLLKLTVSCQLHRATPAVKRFELIHVILRALYMEWSFQTHKARNPSNEGSAVRGLRIPHWRGRLQMLDMGEDLLGIGLAQIDPITGQQILLIKVAVTRPRLGGDPH